MLVLSRKAQETIVIGTGESRIEVTVLWIGRNRVSLSVEAPRSVGVDREEIALRKQRERGAA